MYNLGIYVVHMLWESTGIVGGGGGGGEGVPPQGAGRGGGVGRGEGGEGGGGGAAIAWADTLPKPYTLNPKPPKHLNPEPAVEPMAAPRDLRAWGRNLPAPGTHVK